MTTVRTTSKTIRFHGPFCVTGVDRLLPPADYRVVTDEELIEGLSFPAYHRVSTVIFVPAQSGSTVEMVIIDPLDLQAALEKLWLILIKPAASLGVSSSNSSGVVDFASFAFPELLFISVCLNPFDIAGSARPIGEYMSAPCH